MGRAAFQASMNWTEASTKASVRALPRAALAFET
jgi:hypothetical protein